MTHRFGMVAHTVIWSKSDVSVRACFQRSKLEAHESHVTVGIPSVALPTSHMWPSEFLRWLCPRVTCDRLNFFRGSAHELHVTVWIPSVALPTSHMWPSEFLRWLCPRVTCDRLNSFGGSAHESHVTVWIPSVALPTSRMWPSEFLRWLCPRVTCDRLNSFGGSAHESHVTEFLRWLCPRVTCDRLNSFGGSAHELHVTVGIPSVAVPTSHMWPSEFLLWLSKISETLNTTKRLQFMNGNVWQYRVVKSVVKLLSVNLLVMSSFCAPNTLLFRFQTLLILLLTCVIRLVTYLYKVF